MALIAGVQYGTPITSTTYTGIPAGTILPCGSTGALTRTLLCDGTSYSRAAYPALFAVIGTAFGYVDGNSFNVPDFRGQFLRGVDGTANKDPDKTSRTAMNANGNTGNLIGSVQGGQFASHDHPAYRSSSNTGGFAGMPTLTAFPAANTDASIGYDFYSMIGNNGGNETRPTNAYVNYCIAY